MKIRSALANNHRHAFIVTAGGREWSFPYALADTPPTREDPIASVWVDAELGREGITYRLASGREDSLHFDHFLAVNRDPDYFRVLLVQRLTLEARQRIEKSSVTRRELIRRLATSPSQLYRLLDPANDRKSIDQLVRLLTALGCDVDLVVSPARTPVVGRSTGGSARPRRRSRVA